MRIWFGYFSHCFIQVSYFLWVSHMQNHDWNLMLTFHFRKTCISLPFPHIQFRLIFLYISLVSIHLYFSVMVESVWKRVFFITLRILFKNYLSFPLGLVFLHFPHSLAFLSLFSLSYLIFFPITSLKIICFNNGLPKRKKAQTNWERELSYCFKSV